MPDLELYPRTEMFDRYSASDLFNIYTNTTTSSNENRTLDGSGNIFIEDIDSIGCRIMLSENDSSFKINNKNGSIVFEIKNNGEIYYMKGGSFVRAECDKDLVAAFVNCISEVSGVKCGDYIKILKEEVLNELKQEHPILICDL